MHVAAVLPQGVLHHSVQEVTVFLHFRELHSPPICYYLKEQILGQCWVDSKAELRNKVLTSLCVAGTKNILHFYLKVNEAQLDYGVPLPLLHHLLVLPCLQLVQPKRDSLK